MCGSNSNIENTKWQKEPPDSEGEWLWIEQWSCGCICHSGIAWVEAIEFHEDKLTDQELKEHEEHYKNSVKLPNPTVALSPNSLYDNPNVLYLSWEGSHYYEGQKIEHMTAWQKIELPPKEWCK